MSMNCLSLDVFLERSLVTFQTAFRGLFPATQQSSLLLMDGCYFFCFVNFHSPSLPLVHSFLSLSLSSEMLYCGFWCFGVIPSYPPSFGKWRNKPVIAPQHQPQTYPTSCVECVFLRVCVCVRLCISLCVFDRDTESNSKKRECTFTSKWPLLKGSEWEAFQKEIPVKGKGLKQLDEPRGCTNHKYGLLIGELGKATWT